MKRKSSLFLATLFACTSGCLFNRPADPSIDSDGASEADAEASNTDRPADSPEPPGESASTDGGLGEDETSSGGLGEDETTDTGLGTTDATDTDPPDAEPVTLYEIQLGVHAVGDSVHVEDVVVTALAHNGFWVQEPRGGQFSGCFVFVGIDHPYTVEVGDEVGLSGFYEEFFDNTQINVTRGSVEATGATGLDIVPMVVPLATATVEPWEGVLVRVQQPLVVVEAQQFGVVIGGVEQGVTANVSNQLFDASAVPRAFPDFGAGASLTSVTGVVTESFGARRLVPRGAADLTGYIPPVPVAPPFPFP